MIKAMIRFKILHLNIPSWAATLYILISIGLIPWTIYLGFRLPAHHTTHNWDIAWVGLDIGLVLTLLATGILARLHSLYTIIFAIVAGTLLLADAWFDITGYKIGSHGFDEALLMAILGELPLALMSFILAVHGVRKLHKNTHLAKV